MSQIEDIWGHEFSVEIQRLNLDRIRVKCKVTLDCPNCRCKIAESIGGGTAGELIKLIEYEARRHTCRTAGSQANTTPEGKT
jgi:hypothetical protein